jgi:hypothetical protein
MTSKYDTEFADITLTRDELRFISESLDVLADVDEGEYWDADECRRVAAYLRENLAETAERDPA